MKCQAYVSDGRWHGSCGREANFLVDNIHLCGRHAAGRRRSEEAQVKANALFKEKMKRGDELRALAERLSTALGIKVTANYEGHDYDGRMIVPASFLEKIVGPTPGLIPIGPGVYVSKRTVAEIQEEIREKEGRATA